MAKEIFIKYHDGELTRSEKIKKGDWIDLRAAETVHMKAFEFRKISLGVSMELPEDHEAWLAPRGSTFERWHIIQTNSFGVIDNSFSGDGDIWKFPALALQDTAINKGDRICQFRIMERMEDDVRLTEVGHLNGPNRGEFGSTGAA